jgi:hypothetical protein
VWQFRLEDVHHGAAVVDLNKLAWLSNRHIRLASEQPPSLDVLVDRVWPSVQALVQPQSQPAHQAHASPPSPQQQEQPQQHVPQQEQSAVPGGVPTSRSAPVSTAGRPAEGVNVTREYVGRVISTMKVRTAGQRCVRNCNSGLCVRVGAHLVSTGLCVVVLLFLCGARV